MTNDIVKPITADGLVGYDGYNQLWVWWIDERGVRCGTIASDVRGKTCPICGQGWEMTSAGFCNQTFCSVTQELVHDSCWRGHLGMVEATMWHNLLCDCRGEARIPWTWKKIPNEYGGAWNTPWFEVRFVDFAAWMKLGSRKRVWHMNLHGLTERQAFLLHLFECEDVTKWKQSCEDGLWEIGVHAWTKEKAREYLEKFYVILKSE